MRFISYIPKLTKRQAIQRELGPAEAEKTVNPRQSTSIMPSEDLLHHVFAFGSPADKMYGQMVLRPRGKILGYSHANERSWKLDAAGDLLFLTESGAISSRLQAESPFMWLGHSEGSRYPVSMVSLLRNDASGDLPPIVVNSIPKSGTYFLMAAMAAAGFPDSGLHLAGCDLVDDNRALDIEQVHRAPLTVRLPVRADLAASIAPGKTSAAHISDPTVIDLIRNDGGHVIHVKRDLRDVVVSMYRFKINKVNPTDSLDNAWRQLPEPQRLIAFLYHHAGTDLAHIRDMSRFIADRTAISYEDMIHAKIPKAIRRELERVRPGFADEVAYGLRVSLGKSTSTQSGARSDWRALWSEDVQRIFVALELQEVNRALGY